MYQQGALLEFLPSPTPVQFNSISYIEIVILWLNHKTEYNSYFECWRYAHHIQ